MAICLVVVRRMVMRLCNIDLKRYSMPRPRLLLGRKIRGGFEVHQEMSIPLVKCARTMVSYHSASASR